MSKIQKSSAMRRSETRSKALDRYIHALEQSGQINSVAQSILGPRYQVGGNSHLATFPGDKDLNPCFVSGSSGIILDDDKNKK